MSSGTAGGSPQRETPVNGEGEMPAVENASPTSETSNKAAASQVMNVGGNSGAASGDSLQTITSSARIAGGMVPSPQSHGAANPPPMNRAGIVPMSRVSGGGGGGVQPPNQGGWHHNQYNSRPPPQMNRYSNDMPPAGYGNYRARPMNNHQGGAETLSKTNLYIRGLVPTTTDQDLIKLCQGYGKIKSTKAIVDQQTNRCKGYGFVDFEKATDADRATQHLQQSGVQAQMAKVRENSLEQDPTNLYIANLPDYVEEHYLESMVRPYGNVVSVRILRDQAGNSRNVGFCRMDSKEMCERIVMELNKKPLPGSKEPLLVKFADSGNRRKREYRTQHPMMGGYDNMPHGHMGGQMLSQGNVGMNARYSMQAVNNQSTYLPSTAAAGNWGSVPMYPQLAMSPANPVTSIQNNILDPTSVLASQLGQMQIAAGQTLATTSIPNYGMQQNQQSYPQMYQNQGMMQPFQYEMSASPPTHLGHVLEEHNNYQSFGQM